jgi:hypothetical protein
MDGSDRYGMGSTRPSTSTKKIPCQQLFDRYKLNSQNFAPKTAVMTQDMVCQWYVPEQQEHKTRNHN